MSKDQSFADKLVEAIGIDASDDWVDRKEFNRLLAVLEKAIEQRNEQLTDIAATMAQGRRWINEANTELLDLARGLK